LGQQTGKMVYLYCGCNEVLTESAHLRRYWSDLKIKLEKEGSQLYDFIVQLTMEASDGKMRLTDVADVEQLFRLIQSIPSPKAEPFKLWLAQLARERLEEIDNPEIGIERLMEYYHRKGYSENRINQRLKSIEVRKELTDEWERRNGGLFISHYLIKWSKGITKNTKRFFFVLFVFLYDYPLIFMRLYVNWKVSCIFATYNKMQFVDI
jgi:hypothetical protein